MTSLSSKSLSVLTLSICLFLLVPSTANASAESLDNRTYVYELSENYSTLELVAGVHQENSVLAAKTYDFYMSKEQVKASKAAIDKGEFLCNFVKFTGVFAVMCSPPADLKEAINKAFYQGKRLKMVYHPCFNYCAYYDYYVID